MSHHLCLPRSQHPSDGDIHHNAHPTNCRKSQSNSTKPKTLGLSLSITASSSVSTSQSNSQFQDVVTTPSPHSQLSQSMASLSPLSLTSNSYHSSPMTDHHKPSASSPPQKCFHGTHCMQFARPSPFNTRSNSCHPGYCNYRKYHFSDKQSAKFSQQVFVAMHTTRQLAWYTSHEPWGDKNSLLFKYLDYTFRCAAFRDEVYTFEEKLYHFKDDHLVPVPVDSPSDADHPQCMPLSVGGEVPRSGNYVQDFIEGQGPSTKLSVKRQQLNLS